MNSFPDQDLIFLFKKMLKDHEIITQKDPIYNEDIREFPLKINWDVGSIIGYQIYEKDHYSYKFGEWLDNADMLLTFDDPDVAKKFLLGQIKYYSAIPQKDYEGLIRYIYAATFETIITNEGKKKLNKIDKPFFTAKFDKEKHFHPFVLLKLPIFRNIGKEEKEKREKEREATGQRRDFNYGVYIPINQSLGKYENTVIPLKVFKHFIEKASFVVMEDLCGCRYLRNCQHHVITLGCMHIGSEMKNVDLENLERDMPEKVPGRVATKEEAIEQVRIAINNGLIPLIGNISESGRMLSMCFCCSCCCTNGKMMMYGSTSRMEMFHRIEGLTVKVDEDICVGCGKCLEVCVFKGMKLKDGIVHVNQKYCLGCGRCENTCPNNAISIQIDNMERIDSLIKLLESYADVS